MATFSIDLLTGENYLLTGIISSFVGAGGTTVTVSGGTVIIRSTTPTGTSVNWGDIYGTLINQTDLAAALSAKTSQTDFNTHTGNATIHFAQSAITINQSQVINLINALAGKSGTGHTHTGVYAPYAHTHPYSGLTGLPTLFTGHTFVESGITRIAVDGNQVTIYVPADAITGVTWNMITGKPDLVLNSTFTGHTSDLSIHYPQSGISLSESQVVNLVSDLAGKSGTGHTHSYTGSTISDKPTFTGSGGTIVIPVGKDYVIYSTTPTGTTAAWSDITNKPSWLSGTTLQTFEAGHTHSQYLTGSTATAAIVLQLKDISGNTDVNIISGVSITWTTQEISGSSYVFTGGSRIGITQTGAYGISYILNVYNQSGGTKNIGAVVRKNGSVDITPTSSTSQVINIENKSGTNSMPSYKVSLSSGDYIELIAFRIGDAGIVLTKPNGSWITLIK